MAKRMRPRLVAHAIGLLGNGEDADDVVQDTLLRLWQMCDELNGYKSPDGLAFVMTRNLALDRLRRPRDARLDDCPEPTVTAAPDDAMVAGDMRRQIDAVMARLSARDRAIITMRHVQGMELEDIATVLDTTPNNVRVLLCRARARVRGIFLRQPQ